MALAVVNRCFLISSSLVGLTFLHDRASVVSKPFCLAVSLAIRSINVYSFFLCGIVDGSVNVTDSASPAGINSHKHLIAYLLDIPCGAFKLSVKIFYGVLGDAQPVVLKVVLDERKNRPPAESASETSC